MATKKVATEAFGRTIDWLVVDAGAIARIDYTAARVIRELQRDLKERI